MKKEEMRSIVDKIILFADAKNNPDNYSILDADDYESIIISYKDLAEINWHTITKKQCNKGVSGR